MLHASKTPDESDNYNHSVRVTYRLGISITRRDVKLCPPIPILKGAFDATAN